MKHIFEPFAGQNLKLKNRLVRSATWEGAAKPDGSLVDELYDIYDELAAGGVGAIITGFTSVANNDHYFDGMMRLSSDALIPSYAKLVARVKSHHCPILAQLALGAFYRPYGEGFRQVEPDGLTVEEIALVREQFTTAALRAQKAGFDGVQIHAAHFFFLSRFISPYVNHRTDSYGGSTENRARLLLEILTSIKEVAPTLHVTMKINSSDFTPGGLEEEESLKICEHLAAAGLDSIEVSGNGTSVSGIKAHKNEAYFANFAATLAERIAQPVILVGGLRSRSTMESILNKTKIQLLSLSRPLLCEPDFPKRLQIESEAISKCLSCNQC
ncbi:MAG: NADH:flavin oxidoreductase, partial [Desulfovibrio sp.]|nr:NADH:flavin oxidoreductase [Desulfovibrio sp.]